MALATVVKVEGSSYRQPGARMLVTWDWTSGQKLLKRSPSRFYLKSRPF
ncbi:XdhC family protein [Olivibacter sp. XZL3]|nr:XdhC family protein [Olivibacter sp. XZL3]